MRTRHVAAVGPAKSTRTKPHLSLARRRRRPSTCGSKNSLKTVHYSFASPRSARACPDVKPVGGGSRHCCFITVARTTRPTDQICIRFVVLNSRDYYKGFLRFATRGPPKQAGRQVGVGRCVGVRSFRAPADRTSYWSRRDAETPS